MIKLIANLATKQVQLLEEIAEMEAALKLKKEELRVLQENDLPEAMDAEGMVEFVLQDGRRIFIATSYHASITEANQSEAFGWLRRNGMDGIIKRHVTMEFGRGEDKIAAQYFEWLRKKYPDRSVLDKSSVHHSTLKAFVRERIEAGDDFPQEIFGVHVRTFADIKEVEVKKARKRA